jgi:hypothetical protein
MFALCVSVLAVPSDPTPSRRRHENHPNAAANFQLKAVDPGAGLECKAPIHRKTLDI